MKHLRVNPSPVIDDTPVKKREVIFNPTPKQLEFIKVALSRKKDKMLFGGAIRGGKSYVALGLAILLCKLFPGSRHTIVRRDYPSIKRTVIPTFEKIMPLSFLKDFNRSELKVTCNNGSQLLFMPESVKDDPELYKFRGLETNTIICEEMNELREKTMWKCIERKGTWIRKGLENCPNLLIGTCNPSQGFVKQLFYNPWKAGTLKDSFYYLPAKITDNPYIPQEYIDQLEDLPPEVYKVFVDGDWEGVDNFNQLVPWTVIDDCEKARIRTVDQELALGADIGRMGSDPTVIVILKGGNIVKVEHYPKTYIDKAADIIQRRMLEYNVPSSRVCIDSVGLGAGVVDILVSKGMMVIPMVGGGTNIKLAGGGEAKLEELTADSHYSFANWKAYSYWMAAEEMRVGHIGGFKDETLRSDAGAVNYFIRNDRVIFIQSKDDMKKIIGKSPDHWDAFTYAVWGWKSDDLANTFGIYTSTQYMKEEIARLEQEPVSTPQESLSLI